MDEETREFAEQLLKEQLSGLVERHFKDLRNVPALVVCPDSHDGPAWLDPTRGMIYIDQRVAAFQDKTTKILLLHELIHWALFLENQDPDVKEGQRFERELSRLKGEGAYQGLL